MCALLDSKRALSGYGVTEKAASAPSGLRRVGCQVVKAASGSNQGVVRGSSVFVRFLLEVAISGLALQRFRLAVLVAKPSNAFTPRSPVRLVFYLGLAWWHKFMLIGHTIASALRGDGKF